MKTKTIFKSMMMAVCCLGIVTLASCKDDKDDNKGLKFSVAKVEVAQGASAKVTIGNGTQPYTEKHDDCYGCGSRKSFHCRYG